MRAVSSSAPESLCAYAQAAMKRAPTRTNARIFRRMIVMPTIVAESMLASRCDFVGEFVGAIPARLDDRKAMICLEQIVALLEIAPESQERRLMGMRCCQCFQAIVREARGENVNR
jgi:hypothetical protein